MSRALLIVFALVLSNFSKCNGYAQSTDATPAEQKEHAQAITPKAAIELDASQREAGDSNPDHANDSADDNSEKQIAKYTKYGVWVSVAQLLVAGIGIYYVVKTLRTTQRQTTELVSQTVELKETNRVMRETHNAERRPWVSCKISKDKYRIIETAESDNRIASAVIQLMITNHGSSPANEIMWRTKLEVTKAGETGKRLKAVFDSEEFTNEGIRVSALEPCSAFGSAD